MPSNNERLNLYLPPEMSEIIRRTSEARGVSRPRVILDLLESIAPQLTKMVELLELAKRAPAAVNADLQRALDRAYDELEPIATEAADAFNTLGQNLEAAVAGAVSQTKRDLHRDAA